MKTFRRIIAAPFTIFGAFALGVGMAIRFGLTGATDGLNAFIDVLRALKEDQQ